MIEVAACRHCASRTRPEALLCRVCGGADLVVYEVPASLLEGDL